MLESPSEGGQPAAMTEGHSQQMRIGDLTVTEKFLLVDEIAGGNREVVLPEDVIGKSDNSPKQAQGFSGSPCAWENMRVRRHSHESALSERAGRPS